jgi:methyl halide transferase
MKLNKEYWEKRYEDNDAPWDVGSITTPIKDYFDQLTSKKIKILIPGAGNSYEFEYLIHHGFKNTYVLDFAKNPLLNIKNRLGIIIKDNLIEADFFEHENQYDLIVEQTFFCALEPNLRKRYVQKMASLLKPNGKIIGLLFQFPLTEVGPPFGGSKEEYLALFENYFFINRIETSYNSIKPRKGNELFFIFTKK